jgi:threonine-phosphate decarboxylase
VLPEALALRHVIVLRSLTKWWAIPGLRLGYLVAAPPLVNTLRALQQPWPVNALAMAVGVELFRQPDDRQDLRQRLREWREVFFRALAAIPGLTRFPTTTNFVLCKLETSHLTSGELTQRLADRGLLIRNCDSFSGLAPGRFIRIAVRTPDENERLLAALREGLRHG